MKVPCYASGDHNWRGGLCIECGRQLRCFCGRFIRVEDIDAHLESGACRVKVDSALGVPEGGAR